MKRYLTLILIGLMCIGMSSCYDAGNLDKPADIAEVYSVPPEPPPEEPPPEPQTSSSLKSIKVIHYNKSGSADYEDTIAFNYDEAGRLKLTTLSSTKEYENIPLIPPLINEKFSYDEGGNLVEIFRQRGLSVNDVKEGGKQQFKYDDSKRLSEETQMILYSLAKPINFWKWTFNNTDPLESKAAFYLNLKPVGEEDWIESEMKALVKFDEGGLPMSLKVEGPTSADYSFEYDEFGVDKMSFDGDAFRVYRDLSGKITHATLEGSKSCSIVEANEINDQNQIVKETWSYIDGECLGWDTDEDKKIVETHEFTYEEVENPTSLPPLGLIHMMEDTFTLYLLDEPERLFGSFMYFYDMKLGLYQ